MDGMFETFDHTADLGLRVRSADLNTLFAEAGLALFATIVENIDAARPLQQVDFNIPGEDREYLLFDFLRELLYRFDGEHLVLCRFAVEVRANGLTAQAWGEPLDRERHQLNHEVKAITYHALVVEPTADGWLAEVIIDI
jgi:SHS2 domain-containing protein